MTPTDDIVLRLRRADVSQRTIILRTFIEDTVLRILRWDDSRRSELQNGFIEVGLDSLLSIELQFRLEKVLGYVTNPEDKEESQARTPEELALVILARRLDLASLATK
jgi:acyl carrier protein